jgi:hypothetical protein
MLHLSICFGCIFRFELVKGHNFTLIFLQGSLLSSLGAAIIPFFSYYYQVIDPQEFPRIIVYLLLGISFVGIGLYKFSCYPIMLVLVSRHFNPKRDGCLWGFWVASREVGNIVCLGVCNFIVYQLEYRW